MKQLALAIAAMSLTIAVPHAEQATAKSEARSLTGKPLDRPAASCGDRSDRGNRLRGGDRERGDRGDFHLHRGPSGAEPGRREIPRADGRDFPSRRKQP